MDNDVKFFLFVDLDDVLIDSHNDMNKDLVNAYGDKYDWAHTVECQTHFDEHLKLLLANHGERGRLASEGIKQIRDVMARDGMRYDVMQRLFNELNSYAYDDKYY